MLPTLVFVFNGNAFGATTPSNNTQITADLLSRDGDKAIQMSTPPIGSTVAFLSLAARIASIADGQPIGLVGFSAGGSLAVRLSELPALHVKAVLNFYGPPDLQDWFSYHDGDYFAQYVTSHVALTSDFVALMSGASQSQAFIVNAFGTNDQNVVASVSTASFERDFKHGQVFTYPGPHGVSPLASPAAYDEFVEHLGLDKPSGGSSGSVHPGGTSSGSGHTGGAPGGTVPVPAPTPVIPSYWNAP
ncbi:MAG TPA: dienelactone hydrolase family protein [Isosphaeraceae bacterium]|nr:dienelactone hydrolase family protein [Isosphaeraceae bacterium]